MCYELLYSIGVFNYNSLIFFLSNFHLILMHHMLLCLKLNMSKNSLQIYYILSIRIVNSSYKVVSVNMFNVLSFSDANVKLITIYLFKIIINK